MRSTTIRLWSGMVSAFVTSIKECNSNNACSQSQWGTCSSSSTTSKTSFSSSIATTSGPITTSGFTSSSSIIKTSSPTTTTSSSLPPRTSIPGEAALPSCGQLCFNNMLGQCLGLDCAAPDAHCLCSNVDFSNGLRDCSYCASATTSPTPTACKTVSGLATPKPSSAICGSKGTSVVMAGAGTLIAYSAGSSYVASLGACSAQCLLTLCCTNIYFIQGKYCNLHYGPNALNNNVGNPLYDYYDATCFTCGALSCPA